MSVAFCAILSNFFGEQGGQNHPQYFSGLSRALFPTTFLETALFLPLQTNHGAIKEINTIFYKFLWNDKGDKIKRKIMINNYSEGGLKIIDI